MQAGLVAGLLANALWGLTFIAPLEAAPASPLDLVLLRYLVFGLGSLAVLAPNRFAVLRSLPARDMAQLVLLGATGNVLYYAAMALAVPRIGSDLVALVIGCLPVLMGLLGNRGAARVPVRKLAIPLLLIGAGIVLVNFAAFHSAQSDPLRTLAGLALALAALGTWCWFGLANARAIAARPQFSGLQWTALLGVGTLVALLPSLPFYAIYAEPTSQRGSTLLLWGLALGLLCSWCATWAWSLASRRLPVTLAAQLIVAETIFALLYGALYQHALPTHAQIAGAICMLAGVIYAVRAFSNNHITL